MTRVLAVALALSAAGALSASAQTTPSAPVIVTQAEGVVKRAADRAWITISAETRDARAADARRRNAEVMTALQSSIRNVGIAADAIRTTSYTLTPEMEWSNGRGTLKGYVARNQIEVRIDDMDKVSDVIDAANIPRGVALNVGPPRFDLKDPAAAETEALRLAVRSALERARAIADGAGRAVGAIVRIDEQNVGPRTPPMPMYRMAEMAASAPVDTPIAPGDIEVRALVTVTVELR